MLLFVLNIHNFLRGLISKVVSIFRRYFRVEVLDIAGVVTAVVKELSSVVEPVEVVILQLED